MWDGGSKECDHVERTADMAHIKSTLGPTAEERARGVMEGVLPVDNAAFKAQIKLYKDKCGKCGAVRVDSQIGMEPLHDCGSNGKMECGRCFVCAITDVFREVYRVLRDDGTVWLNLGDSYIGSNESDLPSGNLVGIPWRIAFALQANGWILRQDVVWSKPNTMPESVTNRCTKSHEYIFLLAKGRDYYFDNIAIQEPAKSSYKSSDFIPDSHKDKMGVKTYATQASRNGRDDVVRQDVSNKRDVWVVPTVGFSGAHFAVFSPQLITPCILASTSEYGCCAMCGKPYERILSKLRGPSEEAQNTKDVVDKPGKGRDRSFVWSRNGKSDSGSTLDIKDAGQTTKTVGWRRACSCNTNEISPCVVLDPFLGSGTTISTAMYFKRGGVGIDLSEKYLKEITIPRIQSDASVPFSERKSPPLIVGAPPPSGKLRKS